VPVDENTRLRIRQYLIELMDEDAADAIMESMPPIPWTELATKEDIARLDGRLLDLHRDVTHIDGRLDTTNERLDGTNVRIDVLTERIDTLADRLDSTNERIDGTNERIDTLADRIGELSHTITVGFLSMAVTLVVLMVGTIASLIAAGAFG
jgi:DNA repair ATPase RecN